MRDVTPWLLGAYASIGPYTDAEILLIDDGSRDETRTLADTLAATDCRIRVLSGDGNGPSAARNIGIAAARAPLIAFLDADDRWRPDKLARQLALHRRYPNLGFSFTDYQHVTQEGGDHGRCFAFWPHFRIRHANNASDQPFLLGQDALAQIFAENVVGTSTVVASTALLRSVGGFRTRWNSAEDWDLWLRLAGVAPVACVPAVLMDYLMHRSGAVSSRTETRSRAMRAIAQEHRRAAAYQNPKLVQIGDARLLIADAEAATRVRALLLQLRALIKSPSRRTARDAARTLWLAAGLSQRRKHITP